MKTTKVQLQKVHKVAMECIKYLIIAKGVSVNQARSTDCLKQKTSKQFSKPTEY